MAWRSGSRSCERGGSLHGWAVTGPLDWGQGLHMTSSLPSGGHRLGTVILHQAKCVLNQPTGGPESWARNDFKELPYRASACNMHLMPATRFVSLGFSSGPRPPTEFPLGLPPVDHCPVSPLTPWHPLLPLVSDRPRAGSPRTVIWITFY